MALSSDPGATAIANEFAGSTRNSVNGTTNTSLYDLDAMYKAVFGSGTHDRRAFDNKEIAGASSLSVSVDSDGDVSASCSVIAGGVTTNIELLYQETNDEAIPLNDEWEVLDSTTRSSNGTQGLSGELPNGEYFIGMRVWNGFCSHSSDKIILDQGTTRHTVSSSSGGTVDEITKLSFDSRLGATWFHTWEYPSSSASFQLEYVYNSGSNWETASMSSLSYDGDDEWSGGFAPSDLPDTQNTIQFRIRANESGVTSQWRYTDDYDI